MSGYPPLSTSWRRTYNYPILGPTQNSDGTINPGVHPKSLDFKLQSQQEAIRSIAIDNPKPLMIKVTFFGGPSDQGTPIYECLPGKSARFSVEGNFPVHVKFTALNADGSNKGDGQPIASGYIFIAVSSDIGGENFSNSDVSGSTVSLPPNTQVIVDPVGSSALGALAVDVLSAPPVTVAISNVDVNPVPPANAFRVIQYFVPQQFSAGSSRIQIDAGPGAGHTLYITNIRISGLNVQPFMEWRFQTLNLGGNTYTLVMRGYGDVALFPPFTYNKQVGGSMASGLYFDFVNMSAIIGTIHFDLYVSGYYI